MKAGKAYISSLGTTGLLIASSLLLLVVVGALVAFDRWPAGAAGAGADTVAIGAAEKAVRARSVSAERRLAVRAEHRVRAARAARVARRRIRARRARAASGAATPPADPVISGLPAPDAVPDGGRGTPRGGAAGPRSGGQAAGTGAGRPSGVLGDAVSGVSPQADEALGDVGQTVEDALDPPLEALGPGLGP